VIETGTLDPAIVPLLPGQTMLGGVVMRSYVKEILGKKTFGKVLNIGAGPNSARYRYDVRLRNTEYHTVEISGEGNPTFVADARHMPEVPSNHYDWVLAFALLEHVDDIHAVIREITRVLKPDGCVYLTVPFHNELHFTRAYGDYWRIGPHGFHKLMDADFGFEEIEFWGECVIDPVTVGVIARKGASESEEVSRLYYLEGGLNSMHRYVDGIQPLELTIPISRLHIDGMEYCLRVHEFRAQHFQQRGISLTLPAADKMLFSGLSTSERTIHITNQQSRLA
jgi:SAM-dependent methyltransferase